MQSRAEFRAGKSVFLFSEALDKANPVSFATRSAIGQQYRRKGPKESDSEPQKCTFLHNIERLRRGRLFMSLIHTCELNGVNPFDYLTELLRHVEELKLQPSEWMPWKYREALPRNIAA